MKKHLPILFAFILLLIAPIVHSQIINPGFETWSADFAVPTANNPNSGNGTTGWWDYNVFNSSFVGSSPISVLRSDTAHSGSYSARVQTVIYTPTSWNYYKSWGIPFIGHNYSDTLGILFDGNLNETSVVYKPGIPFTQKITKFSFYYLYTPKGVDSAECRVLLVKKRNAVAGGVFKTSTATGTTWQQATINMIYVDTLTPDTMYILFSSSSLDSKPKPGSVLWLDDVSVTGPSGINQVLAIGSSIRVYPNPASDAVNFQLSGLNNAAILSIFDIAGQKIGEFPVNNNIRISTQSYSNGLYFYQFYDNTGSIIKTGKFSVNK